MSILVSMQLVDEKLFTRLFQGKSRLKKWARLISRSGDGSLYVVLPLLYWFLNPVQGRTFFYIALTAFILERTIYYVLKKNLKRRRPPAAIPGFKSLVTPSDEFSFPSGHTSGAFLFVTMCVLWFGSVASPLYLWAMSIGFSRVLLGVHFPGDILAGALIGVATGCVVFNFI
jgi:undecaprenyl-diphosphatase